MHVYKGNSTNFKVRFTRMGESSDTWNEAADVDVWRYEAAILFLLPTKRRQSMVL
jgi:hypothetical protein